ncbi:MAG TPA: MCE family protein [Pseudonocardia sp.]
MLPRLVKGQVVAFVVITVLAVGYCLTSYVRLPDMLGVGRHELTVQLPDTGELYPDAQVTLGGVAIGEVSGIELTDTGVVATVSVDEDTPIPANSRVTVRSVSAIGEQYLNFDPPGTPGPPLAAGDVVPAGQVRLPTSDTDLLRHANALLASVPPNDLRTTVDGLSDALTGRAADLRRLVDSSGALLRAADADIGPTRRLIDDLNPVLDTQRRLAPPLRSAVGGLRTVTDQLRDSDPALRGTLTKTAPALGQVDRLVGDIRRPLPELLSGLTPLARVLQVYQPNLRHTLVVLPTTLDDLQSSVYNSPVPGTAKLSFKTVVNDPPPCTTGFLGQRQREPNDLSPARPAVDAYCKEPADSPIGARMGRHDPCPDDPAVRSRTAAGCGLDFQDPAEAARAQEDAVRTQLEVAASNPETAPRPASAPPQDPGGVGTR